MWWVVAFLISWSSLQAQSDLWKPYQDLLGQVTMKIRVAGVHGVFYHVAVDYQQMKTSTTSKFLIREQLQKLQEYRLSGANSLKYVFWINAYNFFTLIDVLNHWGKQQRVNAWPENKTAFLLGYGRFTRQDMKRQLLALNPDPRVFFALCDASVSSPSLQQTIYRVATVNADLTANIVNALKSPLFMRLNHRFRNDKHFVTSKLFDMNKHAFGVPPRGGVLTFITGYAPSPFKMIKRFGTHIEYDWRVNSAVNLFSRLVHLKQKYPASEIRIVRE